MNEFFDKEYGILTKRDIYAIYAMQALISHNGCNNPHRTAEQSYDIALAMAIESVNFPKMEKNNGQN